MAGTVALVGTLGRAAGHAGQCSFLFLPRGKQRFDRTQLISLVSLITRTATSGYHWRLRFKTLGSDSKTFGNQKVQEASGSVDGGSGSPSSQAQAPISTSLPRQLVQTYHQNVHLFLAAVAQGMPASESLAAFAHLSSGLYFVADRQT